MTETAPIKIGGLEIRYIVDGTVTGARSGLFELTVAPGAKVPPAHSHAENEEIVYVLEGALRYSVDAETRDLGVGEHMRTPPGSVHAFGNPFEATARALIALTPDIGAGYFREVAAVATAPGGPDPAKMVEVMARHGLRVAKP